MGMVSNVVECLNCGATRRVRRHAVRPVQPDECVRCGYVGWADATSLSETLRRSLREHTLESRRFSIGW